MQIWRSHIEHLGVVRLLFNPKQNGFRIGDDTALF